MYLLPLKDVHGVYGEKMTQSLLQERVLFRRLSQTCGQFGLAEVQAFLPLKIYASELRRREDGRRQDGENQKTEKMKDRATEDIEKKVAGVVYCNLNDNRRQDHFHRI
jgi:hypothetical protein